MSEVRQIIESINRRISQVTNDRDTDIEYHGNMGSEKIDIEKPYVYAIQQLVSLKEYIQEEFDELDNSENIEISKEEHNRLLNIRINELRETRNEMTDEFEREMLLNSIGDLSEQLKDY